MVTMNSTHTGMITQTSQTSTKTLPHNQSTPSLRTTSASIFRDGWLGLFFLLKRGACLHNANSGTVNIQHRKKRHGGTHHGSVLVDTHDLDPWEKHRERHRRAAITSVPQQLSSAMRNRAQDKVKHYTCVSPCHGGKGSAAWRPMESEPPHRSRRRK